MEESIYDLIPEPYVPQARPPRHHSKFSGAASTSYSTFPASATHDSSGAKLFKGPAASIGREVGHEINPKKFLKAHCGAPPLPPVKKFHREEQAKPPVPLRSEKPVMGLVSDKNFVVTNAVEAIVTAPKKTMQEEQLAVNGPNFGKVPKYLETRKKQISAEQEASEAHSQLVQEYQDATRAQYYNQVAEAEKEELLQKLKERWEEKHKVYQALPFARDTAMQIARKEAIEKEMKEIETAIEKLNKKVVYVYNDTNPQVARWAKQEAMSAAQKKALGK